MRIKFIFNTPNNYSLPINNQHILNGYIHKVLGVNNKYHDTPSNYNISNIRGGVFNKNDNRVYFNNKLYFYVSSNNMEFINNFISNSLINNSIEDNVVLNNTEFIYDEIFDGYNHFSFISPLILKYDEKYLRIGDDEFENALKTHIYKILKTNNIKADNYKLEISRKNTKRKLVVVKGINNPCSIFSFTIIGDKSIAQFLYDNGIGMSRGSGFGMIVPSNKFMLYN